MNFKICSQHLRPHCRSQGLFPGLGGGAGKGPENEVATFGVVRNDFFFYEIVKTSAQKFAKRCKLSRCMVFILL